jgi:hypothetical protein
MLHQKAIKFLRESNEGISYMRQKQSEKQKTIQANDDEGRNETPTQLQ